MINSDISMDVILEAMSISYSSIFLVNVTNENIVAFRRNPKLPKQFWDFVDSNPSYDELLKYYIDYFVASEQDRMFEMTCLKSLQQLLNKQSTFSYDHRLKSDKDNNLWYRMRIVNYSKGEELSLFVVGFENISTQKIREENSYVVGKRLLIIDDDSKSCSLLTSCFSGEFDIICVDNVEEGWINLVDNYEDTLVVILDLDIASGDSFEFLEKFYNVQRYRSIPILVSTESKDSDTEIRILKAGASDILAKPYNLELVKNRVKSLVRLRTATAMLNTLKVDPLTGFYNKDFFFRQIEEILNKNTEDKFRIIVSDIEKFKVINEKYGVDIGNEVLKYMARTFREEVPNFILGGRIGPDVFAILQKDSFMTVEDNKELAKSFAANAPVPNLVINQGVYIVDREEELSAQTMCDRASLALNSIKGVYGKYHAIYDDKLRQELLIQQQIVDNMEKSLENHEFKVYLQPKQDIKHNCVAGAEALVRWIHPELGFMNPGLFIPIFEKNGFIKNLDGYVFEQVCLTLFKWKNEGRRLIPISVNLSRRDFEVDSLAEDIISFVDSLGLEHSLIHFEVTETAFIDDSVRIANIIRKLHNAGFIIALDDFGTGYSSLTTLNSIDIDILKLDMSIIKNDIPGSERNVLEFCMQLVAMMDLCAVAEGAETKEQVDRLASIGCDYIQGYYFSKPIPIADFEKNLLDKKD